MQSEFKLFQPGTFAAGCNYWASHAGLFMWRNWNAEQVEADLHLLAENGIKWLRVFPLWPDFQPIHLLRGQNGKPVEIRFGEEPLPETPEGQAGLSEIMLQRFETFCDIAEKLDLKLVVGLITGWMSGRLFVPPALEGLNPITNPTSIVWQIRFVTGFINRMKTRTAIDSWDLGNECNCMGEAPDPNSAYLWTAAIANAIRRADPDRQVVSGMHSLSTPMNTIGNSWHIDHQAELTDILTTHPYPFWVRHTNIDPVGTLRTSMHATAESRFYSDIGGKPCIAEEIGTMGPMIASDAKSADFVRINMLSLWVNDCRALAWWCGHDQTSLSEAPYDWNGVEVELGLLRNDGTVKPVLQEIKDFSEFQRDFPFHTLTKPETDAVVLLTENQDDWAVAYSTHILAKQAKLSLSFRHIHQELPDAALYLLPSLSGANPVPKRKWLQILDKVKAGAVLYMSLGDGVVPFFNEVTGVEIKSRGKASQIYSAIMESEAFAPLPMYGADDLQIENRDATILATRADNHAPVYWKNQYGKGEIFVFAAPIEQAIATIPRIFDQTETLAYWHIYRDISAQINEKRVIRSADPDLAITQHPNVDGTVVVAVLNHSGAAKHSSIEIASGYRIQKTWRGSIETSNDGLGNAVKINAFDGILILLES